MNNITKNSPRKLEIRRQIVAIMALALRDLHDRKPLTNSTSRCCGTSW